MGFDCYQEVIGPILAGAIFAGVALPALQLPDKHGVAIHVAHLEHIETANTSGTFYIDFGRLPY